MLVEGNFYLNFQNTRVKFQRFELHIVEWTLFVNGRIETASLSNSKSTLQRLI